MSPGSGLRGVAAITLAIATASALAFVVNLHLDPSPLAVIPDTGNETAYFAQLAGRFGLDRTLVVAFRPPGGVFTVSGLGMLGRLSEALRQVPGVARVVSLTTIAELVRTPDGVEAVDLVDPHVGGDAELAALRQRVLANPLVAGDLVSRDGAAALMVVVLAAGAEDPRQPPVTRAVLASVDRELGAAEVQLGGQPVEVVAGIEGARGDFAALGLVLVVLMAGTIVAAARGGALRAASMLALMMLPALWVGGARGHADRPANGIELLLPLAVLVLSAPFALGLVTPGFRRPRGLVLGSAVLLVPVSMATVRLSLVEYSKMRIAATVGVALTVLLVALWRPRGRAGGSVPRAAALAALAVASFVAFAPARGPAPIPSLLPPPAPDILRESFDQGDVLLVSIRGDVHDPIVLERVADLEVELRGLPGVSHVAGVGAIVRHLGALLGDGRRVPLDRGKLGNMLFFVDGAEEVKSLLAPAGDEMLIVAAVTAGVDASAVASAAVRTVDRLNAEPLVAVDLGRLPAATMARLRRALRLEVARRLGALLARPPAALLPLLDPPRAVTAGALSSGPFVDEMVGSIEELDVEPSVARALVAEAVVLARPSAQEIRRLCARIAGEDLADDVADVLQEELARAIVRAQVGAVVDALGPEPGAVEAVRALVLGLTDPIVARPAAEARALGVAATPSPFFAHVTGPPIFLTQGRLAVAGLFSREGRAGLIGLSLAGLAAGTFGPAIPLAGLVGYRSFVSGPSLIDAGLLPAGIVVGTFVLLLADDRRAARRAAAASAAMAVAITALAPFLVSPLLRELAVVLALLSAGAAAGYLGRPERVLLRARAEDDRTSGSLDRGDT